MQLPGVRCVVKYHGGVRRHLCLVTAERSTLDNPVWDPIVTCKNLQLCRILFAATVKSRYAR